MTDERERKRLINYLVMAGQADAVDMLRADAADMLRADAAEIAALKARIDALMLEYCPLEMTEEQIEEWGKHQQRCTPEQESQIKAAFAQRSHSELTDDSKGET